MLPVIEYTFSRFPVKYKVANELYSNGLSIRGNKIMAGEFDVSVKSVADALGVNRKTIYSFMDDVNKDFVLKEIFSRLRSHPSLTGVAPVLGYEVLEAQLTSLDALKLLDYLRKMVNIIYFHYSDNRLAVIYEPNLSRADLDFIASLYSDVHIITPDLSKKRIVCENCKVEYCPRRVKHV